MKLTALSLQDVLADPLMALQILLESLVRNFVAESWFWTQLVLTLALGLVVDLVNHRNIRKTYLSKSFRVDFIYAIFDLLHVWHFLVLVPAGLLISNFLKTNAGWMRIDTLAGLPAWAQLLVLFAVVDFAVYFYHRLQHQSVVLWQFHKIHHSQEQLTALTTFRVPVLDRLVTLAVLSIPAAILSVSYSQPMIILAILTFHQLLIHSGSGWTFGWFGKFIVSPAFHETHHSTHPTHIDTNFGSVLVIWDRLFGSVAKPGHGNKNWGVVDERIPESFIAQQCVPLIGLYRLARTYLARLKRGEPS